MPETESISELSGAAPPIDATDIVLSEDAHGMGKPWESSNAALDADGGSTDITKLLGSSNFEIDPKLKQEFIKAQNNKTGAMRDIEGANERRYMEDRNRLIQGFNAEQFTLGSIPKWDVESERAKYKTDPIESFGSFATVFAMLASAATRAPMENALNGAAAAMNARRDNNEFEYQRSLDAFKLNSELAFKMFDKQHAQMQDAFGIMEKDTERGKQKILEVATRFNDEKTLAMYNAGMFPEIIDVQSKLQQARVGAANAVTNFNRMKETQRHNKAMEQRAQGMSAEEAQTVKQLTAKYEQERQANGLEPDPAGSRFRALEEVNKVAAARKGTGTSGGAATLDRDAALEARKRYDEEVKKIDPNDPEFETKRRAAWDKSQKDAREISAKGKKPNEDLGTYKGTEAQNKNLMFATMADRALANIEKVKKENNYKPTPGDLIAFELMEGARRSGGDVNLMGMGANYYLSPAAQQYYQAAREFTAGVLRKETGAAFAQNELRNTITRYIDSPGDSPELEKQKEQARAGERKMMWMSTGLPNTAWSMDAAEAVLGGKKPPMAKEKPEPVSVGSSTKSDREGQTYKKDGWVWEKRGDKLIPIKPESD